MNDPSERIRLLQRLDELERRLAHVESTLVPAALPAQLDPPPAAVVHSAASSEDELEFEVGRNWFARVGVGVLTLGAGFSLTLPFASLPVAVPSLVGAGAGAALFFLARRGANALGGMAEWLQGSALLLGWGAVLRLYFFGATPLLSTASFAGQAVLALAVAAAFALAWRRHSPVLIGLALVLGHATALAVGTAAFVLPALLALAALANLAARRGGWPGLVLANLVLLPATYFLWAAGDPLLGHPFHLGPAPIAGPLALLAASGLLGAGLLGRLRRDEEEDGLANTCALLNCALGFGVFLVHTAVAFRDLLAPVQAVACAVYLGLAALFWMRAHSRVSTFLYAMTGYLALTVAIIKSAAAPGVFVWLSLQSVVVVATAIWFRSRFIVVANFLIFVAIVLAYLVVAEAESGISIGFGLVALVTARILNWQQDRLELKTGLMRNAYLLAAFVVFPYALYHLTPVRFVGLAWVGLALFYYVLGVALLNQKFRWMGHATLLLTTAYVAIIGTSRFGPVLRVLSFLALGTVMLAVSMIFTRRRSGTPRPPPS